MATQNGKNAAYGYGSDTGHHVHSTNHAYPQQQSEVRPFINVICKFCNCNVVGVLRPKGVFYFYEYSTEKREMILHDCRCQPIVTEGDISPLYAEWSDLLGDTVIFVHNSVSNRIEQYVYRFETNVLEEFEKTDLTYDSKLYVSTDTVAVMERPNGGFLLIQRGIDSFMKKEILVNNRPKLIAPAEVQTTMMKAIGFRKISQTKYLNSENEDYEGLETESIGYLRYTGSICKIVITWCFHAEREHIVAFNGATGLYDGFFYDNYEGIFYKTDCVCSHVVHESHLIPKYLEEEINGKMVFHVYNRYTGLMEKYIFNHLTYGFEQVIYPGMPYDPSKTTESNLLLVVNTHSLKIRITRDTEGRIHKENYCTHQKRFVTMAPVPVKTLAVMRNEKKEKMQVEMLLNNETVHVNKNTESTTSRVVPGNDTVPIVKEAISTTGTAADEFKEYLKRNNLSSLFAPTKLKSATLLKVSKDKQNITDSVNGFKNHYEGFSEGTTSSDADIQKWFECLDIF